MLVCIMHNYCRVFLASIVRCRFSFRMVSFVYLVTTGRTLTSAYVRIQTIKNITVLKTNPKQMKFAPSFPKPTSDGNNPTRNCFDLGGCPSFAHFFLKEHPGGCFQRDHAPTSSILPFSPLILLPPFPVAACTAAVVASQTN